MPKQWRKFRTCRRIDMPGHSHYLTFSCWRKLPLLSRERTCRWLLDALNQARLKHPFDLWAFVLMPEHAHILLLPHEGVAVSNILKAVKEPPAKRAIAWARSNRPEFMKELQDRQPSGRSCHRFWQPGGGYDRNICTAQELHEKIRYIHANPLRRGLVDDPCDWPWSSCRAWETGIDEPIALDRDSLPPLET